MCGEVKSKEKDKTASTPLVTVSDLQRLSQFEIIVLRRRMMPFKTRFKTDFEVDWGRKYEMASYPTHEKREVKLFDIREFVKKKKQEKMSSAFGGEPMGNPFVGGGYSSPFGGPPPMMNPFLSNSEPSNKSDSAFNVDDLVKRIDAKIAELEKEEAEEKNKDVTPPVEVIENKDSNKVEQPIKEPEDKVNLKDISFNNNVQEDSFFDDFFDDDDDE